MKRSLHWSHSVLLILSILLVSCTGTPSPTAAPTITQIPAISTAAPTEGTAPDVEWTETDLDSAFGSFLDEMESYNTITLDELSELLAEEQPPFLLDVRSISEVEAQGYIEGATVIPLRDLAKSESIALLPSFDTTIVSYCGSGWRCTIAMTTLGAMGWTDVLSLKEGSFAGWLQAGYPFVTGLPQEFPLNVAQPDPALLTAMDKMLNNLPNGWGGIPIDSFVQEFLNNPNLIILDVRRAEELLESGMIENSINIPLDGFITRKAEWTFDKNARIIVCCGSGHRSTIAMTILRSYGYSDVYSLVGGLGTWVEAGLPLVEAVVEN
jgi:rhodanese-related sulfurtransferase